MTTENTTESIEQILGLGAEPTETEIAEEHAAEQQAEPASEAPAAEPVAAEPAAPQHRTVPYEALAEERIKRQQLQDRMAQLEQGYTRMLERMQAPPSEPVEEEVSFDEDPIGYLRRENERLQAQLSQFAERVEAPVRAQQQIGAIQGAIAREEQAFVAEVPDYPKAVEWIQQRRVQELTALGLSQQEIQQTVAYDVLQMRERAQQTGVSLPSMVYNYAKRLGWSGAEAPAAPSATPSTRAPSSLGGTSAAPADNGMPSLESISAMDDAEFDTFWKKYEKAARMG